MLYMFRFNRGNLAEQDFQTPNHLQKIVSEECHLIPFQIYRVGILHPDTWQIYVNPSKTFAFHDGFAKIDRSADKNSRDQASLSLRWAKLKKPITIDEYMEEIQLQYKRKQKKNKKDHFEIVSIEQTKGLPHKAYLMYSSIRANHSVYRSLGKEETILSMQLTTYCDITRRLVIASIASKPEDFKEKEELYKKILFSLTCH